MANDKLTLKLEVDATQSIQSIDLLEKELNQLKTTIKGVAIGSDEFKKMQTQIIATESKVKNLNKSFEGLDKEAMAGEWGKLAGGISAGIGAIAVVAGGANQSVEKLVKTVATTMAVVQGFKGAAEAAASAQKLWNIAMTANPIGIIVVAIAAFVGAIVALIAYGDKIKTMLDGWGEKFNFLKGPINVVKGLIDGLTNAWHWLQKAVMGEEDYEAMVAEKKEKRETEAEVKRLERLKARRTAEGASAEELYKIEQDLIANKLKLQEEGSDEYLALEDQKIASTTANNKKIEEEDKKKYDEKLKRDKEHKDMLLKQEVDFQTELQNYINELSKEDSVEDDFVEPKDPEQSPAVQEALAQADYIKSINEDTSSFKIETMKNELVELEKLNKLKQVSDEAYAKRKKELELSIWVQEHEQTMNRMKLAAMLLNSLNQLIDTVVDKEKQTAEQRKRTAIVQANIQIAMAVLNALSSGPPPLNFIMAGIVGALGAVQLVKMTQQKFAGGGILNGPSHANGGILTPFGEVEGGEGVINKNSMSNPNLRNIAAAVNVAGGGNNFGTGDGSIHLSSTSIQMIADAINNKKVYVVESDITNTQNKVKVMENAAVL